MKFTRDYLESLERFMVQNHLVKVHGKCFTLSQFGIFGVYKLEVGCLGATEFVGTMNNIIKDIEKSQFNNMEV